MSLTIWVALHYQTVVHVAISGCIAPFLLLRTEAATKLALSWFETDGIGVRSLGFVAKPLFLRLTPQPSRQPRLIAAVYAIGVVAFTCFVCVAVAVACLVARVASTIIALMREPTTAFRAVTVNWRRVSCATDMNCQPELLPGLEGRNCPSALSQFMPGQYFPKIFTASSGHESLAVILLTVPMILFVYLPSFIYRFSLKSTSLIYMPFMFVIRSHIGEDLTAKERIHDVKFGATETLQWWYSLIVVIANCVALSFLSARIAVLNHAIDAGGPMMALLCDLFLPTNGQQLTLKAWHLARFANSAIVLWLFHFADRAERRLGSGRWTDNQVTTTFEIVRRVQVVLALYTTSCALSRVIQFALYAKVPPVGFEFLP